MRLKTNLLFLFFSTLIGCVSKTADTKEMFAYQKTVLGTLKEMYRIQIDDEKAYDARVYFLRKNKPEVLKTLEVVEEVEVQKDVFLVFYRFSIGTEICKQTVYMKKIDGLYLPYSKYFSSYADDPFKNGKGDEAKELLKRADTWSENENIWWEF